MMAHTPGPWFAFNADYQGRPDEAPIFTVGPDGQSQWWHGSKAMNWLHLPHRYALGVNQLHEPQMMLE